MRNNRSLPCLTGARFVAALLVVLFHFAMVRHSGTGYHGFGIFFDYGRQAVSFFFILSGVVLTYTYCNAISSQSIGWLDFFNLRLSRIVPVHFATWLIATVLQVWFAWRPNQGGYPVAYWIMGLFCIQVYWPSADCLFRWNGQAWSISCELFFYALFPFLLLPLARRLKSAGSIIATMFGVFVAQAALYLCASGILTKLIYPGHPFLGYQTYTETTTAALLVFPPLRLGEFIIGMCIGLMILQQGRLLKSSRNANLLLCLCAVALVVLNRLPGLGPVAAGTRTYLLFVPVLALTLVALVSGLTFITPLLENRFAILLGEASYSLYLVHGFFISSKISFASCLLGSIGSSVILYWLLERPARKIWRKVFTSQRTTNAKPVAHSGSAVIGIGPNEPICIPASANQLEPGGN
jgi:peptidoglycan/LPS O-acetylase OafA/YrhL